VQNGEGFAFELLSVGTAVVGMNQALWKPSDEPTGRTAYMVMYTGSIMYRVDGGTPSSTSGMPFIVGSEPRFLTSAAELQKFKAVAMASDSKLAITYER